MATLHYRNLLEKLVREGRRTIEETCEAYERAGRTIGERATLSPRQLARWMKGEIGRPRPVALRVAEQFWGFSFEALLGPVDAGSAQVDAVRSTSNHRALRNQYGQVDPDGVMGIARVTLGGVPSGSAPRAAAELSVAEEDATRNLVAAGEREAGEPTKRRQAINALGGAAIGGGLGGWFVQAAIDAMEFTRRAEATDIGPLTLEHLELAIAGMAGAFAFTPPIEMFNTAQAYRQRVATLIDGRQTLRQRRELYRLAGWLSIILGWLSHDLGDPLAAEAHCLDAWEHGWQADDGEICAWAMDTSATVAMYNNRPARARDAAARGIAQAPAGSAVAVRLSCQLTRAYGRLRMPDRFDYALASTRRQFEELPSRGSGLFSADAGRIASYAATSSIWLGRPDDAVRHARDALDFYARVEPAERSPTREAISRLDLGLAFIAKRQPDAAAEEVLLAFDSERVTGAVLARAAEVDAALVRAYPTLAVTGDVHERYRALTRSGPPQLTT